MHKQGSNKVKGKKKGLKKIYFFKSGEIRKEGKETKQKEKGVIKRERVEDSLTKVIIIIIIIISGIILHTFPSTAKNEGGAAFHHSPALYALLHEAGTVCQRQNTHWSELNAKSSLNTVK